MSPALSVLLTKSQPPAILGSWPLISKCLLSSQCFLLKVSPYSPWKFAFNLKMSAVLSVLLAKSQPLLSLEVGTLFKKCLLSSQCFLLKVSPQLSLEVSTLFSKCLLSSQCFLLKVSPLLSLEVGTLSSKCLLSSQCFLL
jgi:hypothetical protein